MKIACECANQASGHVFKKANNYSDQTWTATICGSSVRKIACEHVLQKLINVRDSVSRVLEDATIGGCNGQYENGKRAAEIAS